MDVFENDDANSCLRRSHGVCFRGRAKLRFQNRNHWSIIICYTHTVGGKFRGRKIRSISYQIIVTVVRVLSFLLCRFGHAFSQRLDGDHLARFDRRRWQRIVGRSFHFAQMHLRRKKRKPTLSLFVPILKHNNYYCILFAHLAEMRFGQRLDDVQMFPGDFRWQLAQGVVGPGQRARGSVAGPSATAAARSGRRGRR